MLSVSVTRLAARAVASARFFSTKSKVAIDVTDASFQRDVIDASHSTPVVLDVWAEYVAPSRDRFNILGTRG